MLWTVDEFLAIGGGKDWPASGQTAFTGPLLRHRYEHFRTEGVPFMSVVFLCLFIVMALVQVVRPQLLWKMNRPLQKPFVKDYDASEPSRAGYGMQRAVGGLVLIAAIAMLVAELN
jgi:hypothetical protein